MAAAKRLRFGITTHSGADDAPAVARSVDEFPSIIQTFQDFSGPFDIEDIKATLAEGAEPIITWEPWIMGKGVSQPDYSLRTITEGAHDDYLNSVADQLIAAGKPRISIRFAHEMNGYWYPWSEQVNGNRTGDYVQAWRHVVELFKAKGLDNVNWIWAPNAPSTTARKLTGLYPGSIYVGQVGLDGYNFGDRGPQRPWLPASELFGDALDAVKKVAPDKDILISETASVESQGTDSKATWIKEMVRYFDDWDAGSTPRITGFVWFNYTKYETAVDRKVDWRLDSSPDVQEAMKEALRTRD